MSEDKVNFYDFGEYRLDVINRELLKNDSPVSLPPKCFEILHLLVEKQPGILKKEELLNSIWSDCCVEEGTLTQHIYLLRKALQQNGKTYIETISKVGYRFTGDVKSHTKNNTEFEKPVENDLPPVVFHNREDFLPSRLFSERNFYTAGGICALIISAVFYLYLGGYSFKSASDSTPISVKNRYTKNIEAHQAYLMGLYHWDSRTEEGLKKAITYFQTAIAKDPTFALAYADLADTYALIGQSGMSFIPKSSAMAQAKILAQKALMLNPDCSEAMTSLAIVEADENRFEESRHILQKAIEINPNNPIPHQRIAWIYAAQNQLDRAVEEMSWAQKLSPQSRSINIGLASLLNIVRRPDESMIFSRRLLELDPDNISARLKLVESLEQLELYDNAFSELQEILISDKNHKEALIILSRIYAKNDQTEKGYKTLKQVLSQIDTENLEYQIALTHNALGNTEETLKWLKKGVEKDNLLHLFIKHDYNLDSLRGNSEFNKIQS